MRGYTHFAYVFRSHRVLLTVIAAFVGGFQVLVLTLVERVDLLGFLENIFQQMPAPAQQLFGQTFMAQFSIAGAVALGYNHPFMLVALSLLAISLPARHVAGEIEQGTMEILFSLPIRRWSIAFSIWTASGFALLLLILVALLGTGFGMMVFPEARIVPVVTLVGLGLNLWLLILTVSSYTFLYSAFSREGGKVTLFAAGLTLFFYFLHFAVQIWPEIEVLRHLTIFNYYEPQQFLLEGTFSVRSIVVLATISLISGSVAVYQLCRRDIPG